MNNNLSEKLNVLGENFNGSDNLFMLLFLYMHSKQSSGI